MKRLTAISVFVPLIIVAILHCGGGSAPEKEFPYEKIKTQTELGDENIMDLYAYSGDLDRATLIEFCKSKKEGWNLAGFYVAAIFDSKQNVVESTSPISAAFGNQEEAKRKP